MPERMSATLWRRAMAFEIDIFLITITYLTTFCVGLLAAWLGLKVAGYDAPSYSLIDTLLLPFGFLSLIVSLAYFIGFASYRGQTPGKAIMRIKIVSMTGGNVTLSMIVVRTLGYFLSGVLFGLGFLMALVTRRQRALHDLLANTHVVAT
ncbi:MAG TPA: RDD family protein [Nitrospirales bacterium]|nr:RDD family protein [Nitrospirales bacterium]HIA14790.1 RDD family protein [Nitrospirales bacterium]HIB54707.1 RDD family protein [Nitrospirales bacterium]HIC04225.1 RDD family protein [Nitrospirales bacterium]HIO21650.1 RDD family protein [Nitrospirales bacterium]